MGKVYFISDTHFGHFNILKYEPCRLSAMAKFYSNGSTVSEDALLKTYNAIIDSGSEEDKQDLIDAHDKMIIYKWNSVVKNDDVVWFLGDFAFKKRELAQNIGRQLKGHKRMIMGNHDRENPNFYLGCGFEYVSKYPILLKGWFLLSHAPFECINENAPFFNLYGHVHSSESYLTRTKNTRCVCIERQNFEPMTCEEFDGFKEKDN